VWRAIGKSTPSGPLSRFLRRLWRAANGIRDSADNNDAYFGESAVPLPVKLVIFDGKKENTVVKLNWVTASEINSDYYLVKRSADGINFITIGRVKSKNSQTGANYFLFDEAPLQGLNYYQLTSVDFDETKEKSSIIVVDFNSKKAGDYTIYGANDELFIKSNELMNINRVDLINEIGQIIKTNTQINGNSLMNVSDISKGVYLLRMESGSEITYKKVVIQ